MLQCIQTNPNGYVLLIKVEYTVKGNGIKSTL